MPETQDHYAWWRLWEENGYEYASPHHTTSPTDARRIHAGHRQFGWAEGKQRPYVSPLTFKSDQGDRTIAPSGYGYTPEPR